MCIYTQCNYCGCIPWCVLLYYLHDDVHVRAFMHNIIIFNVSSWSIFPQNYLAERDLIHFVMYFCFTHNDVISFYIVYNTGARWIFSCTCTYIRGTCTYTCKKLIWPLWSINIMNDPSLYNESSPQWENKIFCTIFKNDKFLFMICAHCCSTI